MNELSPLWTLECRFPSDHGAACKLMDEVIDQLTQRGWSNSDCFAVQLGLEEGLTNAIRHGNQGDPDKFVELKVELDDELIRIWIVDEGTGFRHQRVRDPTKKSNRKRESGRGVALIRNFMDEVHYHAPGNRLEMVKRRSHE